MLPLFPREGNPLYIYLCVCVCVCVCVRVCNNVHGGWTRRLEPAPRGGREIEADGARTARSPPAMTTGHGVTSLSLLPAMLHHRPRGIDGTADMAGEACCIGSSPWRMPCCVTSHAASHRLVTVLCRRQGEHVGAGGSHDTLDINSVAVGYLVY
jgi:hypothetical protein